MPFDAAAPAEVTARDRMIRLRDFLSTLPDDEFDYSTPVTMLCGTAFCIGGWARELFVARNSREPVSDTARAIGLDQWQANTLFYQAPLRPSRDQAVAVLDHYLATGEVDWDAAIAKLASQG